MAPAPLKFQSIFVLELVDRNHLNNVCVGEPWIEGDFKYALYIFLWFASNCYNRKENSSTSPDDEEYKNTQVSSHTYLKLCSKLSPNRHLGISCSRKATMRYWCQDCNESTTST